MYTYKTLRTSKFPFAQPNGYPSRSGHCQLPTTLQSKSATSSFNQQSCSDSKYKQTLPTFHTHTRTHNHLLTSTSHQSFCNFFENQNISIAALSERKRREGKEVARTFSPQKKFLVSMNTNFGKFSHFQFDQRPASVLWVTIKQIVARLWCVQTKQWDFRQLYTYTHPHTLKLSYHHLMPSRALQVNTRTQQYCCH